MTMICDKQENGCEEQTAKQSNVSVQQRTETFLRVTEIDQWAVTLNAQLDNKTEDFLKGAFHDI